MGHLGEHKHLYAGAQSAVLCSQLQLMVLIMKRRHVQADVTPVHHMLVRHLTATVARVRGGSMWSGISILMG